MRMYLVEQDSTPPTQFLISVEEDNMARLATSKTIRDLFGATYILDVWDLATLEWRLVSHLHPLFIANHPVLLLKTLDVKNSPALCCSNP